MGIATDMKNLSDDIIVSHDMRVKAIGGLVKDTRNMLKGFQKEHEEMADNLRMNLDKGETQRLKDFKSMMADTQHSIREIENYVANRLKEFSNAHADMRGGLIKELVRDVGNTVKATKKLMSDIQSRQKERNAEIADLMDEFRTEREKMAASWQALTATMAKKRGGNGKAFVSAGEQVMTVEEAIGKKGAVPKSMKKGAKKSKKVKR